jgi:hypothetical protein
MEQKNKKGICRDREDLLEDEGGKEGGKGIIPFATKMLVKSVIKDRRDKFREIEMFFKELEKGRGIVDEHISAV